MDKDRSNQEEGFISASFDLQSVLQLPSNNVSLTYYSRKLCVYNLTVWEGKKPNDGHCFCWPEIEGKRGSNEIASCIFRWLEKLPRNIHEVSLFSDTCSGQNRNQQMAALMMWYIQRTSHDINIITHNFLESGHSMMEVDSMHAAIEHEKKYIDTFTMHDLRTIFMSSRRKNPYKVQSLDHSMFYFNFKTLAEKLISNKKKKKTTDDSGDTMNWLLVKSLQYRRDDPHALHYRYNYEEQFKRVNLRGRGKPVSFEDVTPKQAYKKMLPISKAKKVDLLKLCKSIVIPKEVHAWYENLPTSETAKDLTPEPAEEDSEDDMPAA